MTQRFRATLAGPRTFWNELPRSARTGAVLVGLMALVAILAPWISPHDPLALNPADKLAAPSTAHWLGTDELGRDVFSRLLHAARVDLPVGILGAALPAAVGVLAGLVAGFFGGWVDSLIMRLADVVQAFPSYILVIALVVAFGQGATSIIVAFTVLAWVSYARLVRTEVLRVKSLAYVEAATTAGLPTRTTLRRHIFPNVVGSTIVFLPSDIVFATLGLAAFSFLGLGIPAPAPEWGAMIAAGQPYLRDQWWLATVPGLMIVVYGFGLALLGDAVEERQR